MKYDVKDRKLAPQGKLRIEWAEPATFPYIPKYRSAPIESPFERALSTFTPISESARIRIGGINGIYPTEAVAIPNRFSGRYTAEEVPNGKSVLSAIWLSQSS